MSAAHWRKHPAYLQEREVTLSHQMLESVYDPAEVVRDALQSRKANTVIALDGVWSDSNRKTHTLHGPELDASLLRTQELTQIWGHNNRVVGGFVHGAPQYVMSTPSSPSVTVFGGGGGGGGGVGGSGVAHVTVGPNSTIKAPDFTTPMSPRAVTREEVIALLTAMKEDIVQQVCDEMQRIEATIREMLG